MSLLVRRILFRRRLAQLRPSRQHPRRVDFARERIIARHRRLRADFIPDDVAGDFKPRVLKFFIEHFHFRRSRTEHFDVVIVKNRIDIHVRIPGDLGKDVVIQIVENRPVRLALGKRPENPFRGTLIVHPPRFRRHARHIGYRGFAVLVGICPDPHLAVHLLRPCAVVGEFLFKHFGISRHPRPHTRHHHHHVVGQLHLRHSRIRGIRHLRHISFYPFGLESVGELRRLVPDEVGRVMLLVGVRLPAVFAAAPLKSVLRHDIDIPARHTVRIPPEFGLVPLAGNTARGRALPGQVRFHVFIHFIPHFRRMAEVADAPMVAVSVDLQFRRARSVFLKTQVFRMGFAEAVGVHEFGLSMAAGNTLRLQTQAKPVQSVMPGAKCFTRFIAHCGGLPGPRGLGKIEIRVAHGKRRRYHLFAFFNLQPLRPRHHRSVLAGKEKPASGNIFKKLIDPEQCRPFRKRNRSPSGKRPC